MVFCLARNKLLFDCMSQSNSDKRSWLSDLAITDIQGIPVVLLAPPLAREGRVTLAGQVPAIIHRVSALLSAVISRDRSVGEGDLAAITMCASVSFRLPSMFIPAC